MILTLCEVEFVLHVLNAERVLPSVSEILMMLFQEIFQHKQEKKERGQFDRQHKLQSAFRSMFTSQMVSHIQSVRTRPSEDGTSQHLVLVSSALLMSADR